MLVTSAAVYKGKQVSVMLRKEKAFLAKRAVCPAFLAPWPITAGKTNPFVAQFQAFLKVSVKTVAYSWLFKLISQPCLYRHMSGSSIL